MKKINLSKWDNTDDWGIMRFMPYEDYVEFNLENRNIEYSFTRTIKRPFPAEVKDNFFNFMYYFDIPGSEVENEYINYFNLNIYGSLKNEQNLYIYTENIERIHGVIFELVPDPDKGIGINYIKNKLRKFHYIAYTNFHKFPEELIYTIVIPFNNSYKVKSISPIMKYLNNLFNGMIMKHSFDINHLYKTPSYNNKEEIPHYKWHYNNGTYFDIKFAYKNYFQNNKMGSFEHCSQESIK